MSEMSMMSARRVLGVVVCAALLGGCGKKGGAGGGKVAFDTVPIELKYDTRDYRKMAFRIQAQLPTGWKMMTEGSAKDSMNTFMPPLPKGEQPSLFSTSSITVSATCHGPCRAEKMDEQIKAAGKARAESPATHGKLLQDGEVRPGVWAFVIELEGVRSKDKSYNVGVTHRLSPEWETVVFCDALLMGKQASMWKAVLEACSSATIKSVDLVVGEERAAAEEANLSKCPATTTLTHTPKEAKPEDPVFTGALHARATSSGTGQVTLELGNVEAGADGFPDALAPGQGVLRLGLMYDGQDGDVLSGKYSLSEGKLRVDFGLRVAPGGTTIGLSSGEGGVEVIARTPKRICGKVDIKDGWRTVQGEFVADIVNDR